MVGKIVWLVEHIVIIGEGSGSRFSILSPDYVYQFGFLDVWHNCLDVSEHIAMTNEGSGFCIGRLSLDCLHLYCL